MRIPVAAKCAACCGRRRPDGALHSLTAPRHLSDRWHCQICQAMPPLDVAPHQLSEGRTDKRRMKTVEYWRWRYRDPKTGRMCRTMFQLTAEEASRYADAERIDGTMLLREVDEDEDTEPGVFCLDVTTPSPDTER